MARKLFAKKLCKKIGKWAMVLSFVALVPGWILLYLVAYLLFSNNLCDRLYSDNTKFNKCYEKHFRLMLKLDKHELINMFTKNRIMAYDRLNQRAVNDAYEALAFLDYVFTKHNIKYTVEGGTEMGAIRHGGLIPWDDDVDLVVFENDDKVGAIIKKEIGLHHVEDKFGWVPYIGDITILPALTSNYINTDLFPNLVKCSKMYKGKPFYTYNFKGDCGRIWNNWYFEYNEIYPLRKCKFGPLELFCKNDVSKLYNRFYGKDWMDVGYTENHSFNDGRNKKIKLTPELRKPALPTNDAWKKWVDLKNNLKKKKK